MQLPCQERVTFPYDQTQCNTSWHTTAIAIIASPTVKDTVIMVKFKYTCIAGAFTLNHIFQYSPSTIVNFVVTDIYISFCFPFKFSNFDLFYIEVFHFIHPLHILVVSDEPRYRPFSNHCFKSSLTIYSPLVILCTRNYHINCSFHSSHKN